MADFSQLYITDKGKALIAKNYAGLATIQFLKMQTSNTAYTPADIPSLTALQGVKQESLISFKRIENQRQVVVEAPFSNTALSEGYFIRCVGLIAVDPDEGNILYAVTIENTGTYFMPPYDGRVVSGVNPRMIVTVGASADVDLDVDPAATPSMAQFEALAEDVETKASAHRFTATIPSTGWTQNADGLYTISVSVPGILASDQDGDVGLVQSGSESTDAPRRDAYALLVRVSAAADAIAVYATDVPGVAIPVRLEVLR